MDSRNGVVTAVFANNLPLLPLLCRQDDAIQTKGPTVQETLSVSFGSEKEEAKEVTVLSADKGNLNRAFLFNPALPAVCRVIDPSELAHHPSFPPIDKGDIVQDHILTERAIDPGQAPVIGIEDCPSAPHNPAEALAEKVQTEEVL